MKPFLKMDSNSFFLKKHIFLLPILLVNLATIHAIGNEQEAGVEKTKEVNPKRFYKKDRDFKNKTLNEELETQLDLFLDGKIKGNSLVLLREKAPDFDANGDVIKKSAEEEEQDDILTRIKIPAKSSVTGISCNVVREFFQNEGLTKFIPALNEYKANITKETLNDYFKELVSQKLFSERTSKILFEDIARQIKEYKKTKRTPHLCFADIVEPSGEKHTVYLTHKNIKTQTADYSPEYELIDFTYDQNYLSLKPKITKSEKE